MKIYVHIGTHKTGTTSIQLTLASNEKALRKQGYLYPQSGRPDRSEWRYGNHELAFSLVGMHDTPLTVWNDFHREIQQSGFDHVIVSAEDFSLANRQQIRELSALLSDYRVSIILYLRDPIDFMKSHYAQRVRSSGYDLKFRDYVEENLWRVNYPAVVTRWREVFDTVIVRPYQPDGVWGDFAQVVGLNSIDSEGRKNVTPADQTHLLRRVWANKAASLGVPEPWQKRISHGRTGHMLYRIYRALGGRGAFPKHDLEWLRNRATPFDHNIDC